MTVKERIFHSLFFEIFGLILFLPFAILIFHNGVVAMTGLAIILSIIAMTWNFIYNFGFDRFFGTDRIHRSLKMRIFHGILFEFGLIFIMVPVLMLALEKNFMTVLFMDISTVIFYLVYAIVFNWTYDIIRHHIKRKKSMASKGSSH